MISSNTLKIRLVGERFIIKIIKIHQNATDYSYTVDVSVSIGDLRSWYQGMQERG